LPECALLREGETTAYAYDRPVHAAQHRDRHRRRATHTDRLDTNVERPASARVDITGRPAELLHVRIDVIVGEAARERPRDVRVATDDHERDAGDCHAGDVKALVAFELHLVHRLRRGKAELRAAVEHGVAASALIGTHGEGITAETAWHGELFPKLPCLCFAGRRKIRNVRKLCGVRAARLVLARPKGTRVRNRGRGIRIDEPPDVVEDAEPLDGTVDCLQSQ
jgi:hypothetical protein